MSKDARLASSGTDGGGGELYHHHLFVLLLLLQGNPRSLISSLNFRFEITHEQFIYGHSPALSSNLNSFSFSVV